MSIVEEPSSRPADGTGRGDILLCVDAKDHHRVVRDYPELGVLRTAWIGDRRIEGRRIRNIYATSELKGHAEDDKDGGLYRAAWNSMIVGLKGKEIIL